MYIYCYTVVCIYTEKGKLQRKQLLIMTMCSHAYNIYIYAWQPGVEAVWRYTNSVSRKQCLWINPPSICQKKSENTDRFTHVYCYLYLQRTQAKNSPGLPPPNHVTVGVQGISAVMPAATTGTMVQWCAMHKKWDHTVKRHEVKQLNYKYIRLSICI